MMKKENLALFSLCVLVFSVSLLTIFKNPDCPFHVDYAQYVKSIEEFKSNGILNDGINGKYAYIFLMMVLAAPLKLLGWSLYSSIVFITSIFQVFLVILFYKYTNSLTKTILMSTTLTFLTFMGQPETVIIASFYLMLYFVYRDKPLSELFIMLASFVRIDFAVFYLFSRKRAALLPMGITGIYFIFLRLLTNHIYFIHSDFGINKHPISALIVFIIGYGAYLLLFVTAKPKNDRLDLLILWVIVLFLVFFLKFPTQKVFFFPILLTFMFYDFKIKGIPITTLAIPLVVVNLLFAGYIHYHRLNECTPKAFNDYALSHNESAYFGVFEPYLSYYGTNESPPYKYQITINCKNATDYFKAEDWRNAQLLYRPYKFCAEPWDGRYE